MALFARNFYGNDDVSFAPFFRFVDALDSHHSNKQRGGHKAASVFRPSFNPKFDVVETKTAYELHGEIPGAERKDISIDFTEPQTIVVRGRVERQRTEGTNPAEADAAAKDSTTTAVAESVTTEAPSEKTPPSSPSLSAHRATVTDEETEAARERGELTEEDRQQVAAPAPAAVAQKKEAPKAKYWFQERSIGEFSRTFSFPVPVDEEAVKASLNNGVLRVTIPKQEKRSNRRVVIA